MITYFLNILRSYSEVTPSRKWGGGGARSTGAPEHARNNEESRIAAD